MGTNAQLEGIRQERAQVERTLRDLRARLQLLEKNRKEANERNLNAHRYNLAITHEYTANLKVKICQRILCFKIFPFSINFSFSIRLATLLSVNIFDRKQNVN